MAAPRQGLPVRLDRAPQRGAAFALANASRRTRTRSISSRSTGSLLIFDRARLVTVVPTLSPMPNGKPLSGASDTAESASSAIAFRRPDYWLKPRRKFLRHATNDARGPP